MALAFGSKTPPVINGWTVLALPEVEQRYLKLRNEVRRLKRELSEDAYAEHPTVKLFAAVLRIITQTVPNDPDAPEFWLKAGLGKFRRAKGHGLPPHYRLFWVFSNKLRVIIFLYLNDQATLRKEGAGTDPYRVFRRMIDRGEIGHDFEANLSLWERTHERSENR